MINEEGYTVEKIPVADIEAESEVEAKKKLLLFNSQYGKIDDQGLYEFIETSGIDFEEFKEEMTLPDIDMEHFSASFYDDIENPINESEIEELETDHQCPECGYKW